MANDRKRPKIVQLKSPVSHVNVDASAILTDKETDKKIPIDNKTRSIADLLPITWGSTSNLWILEAPNCTVSTPLIAQLEERKTVIALFFKRTCYLEVPGSIPGQRIFLVCLYAYGVLSVVRIRTFVYQQHVITMQDKNFCMTMKQSPPSLSSRVYNI